MAKGFDDLLELAKKKGPKKLAVAVAQDREVLLAVKKAKELGIADAILVGDKKEIEKVAKEVGLDLAQFEVIDEVDNVLACRKAVSLVSSGSADVVMKGIIDTAIIMKQVLDSEIGLRTGKVISHVAVFSVPTYEKILTITDAAMNIHPDLNQKKEIVENAVSFAHSLDIDNPKVAIVCAREKVSPKMEATVHAKELEDMNKNGEITDCIVGGPLALDNAISKEAAKHKGIDSPVAGDADILVVPNIEAGNVLYKSLTFFAGAKNAGLIVGTSAPIVLTSRSDTEEAKLYSIALGVLMASKN
ncbi:phosphate butyryltransferase [Sporanaerobacter acetigenes]|uniref:Phosphate butyryltransferase n=1 Tax=Sporanaerobacter acetigenes DSM 13106 TaxID=1123281 RepID=A0A1M5XB45_9FIRM|nr:phosphate butyryltransferase [Sporanaerobacter acetigenes]SHH96862.1 phosphate butyryltransferase [Sporanaerobacter acetigenes DSM 13106]